jgi:hypothetical protein
VDVDASVRSKEEPAPSADDVSGRTATTVEDENSRTAAQTELHKENTQLLAAPDSAAEVTAEPPAVVSARISQSMKEAVTETQS